MTHSDQPTWAILQVDLRPPRSDAARHAESVDRLQDLGALLALHPAVTGVETRDGDTWTHRERPQLLVYTTPDRLEELHGQVKRQAANLELQVTLRHEVHAGEAWRDVWKQHYRPQVFGDENGRSLLLRPSWLPRQPHHPPTEIVIDPGRAFGTGLHASTRLCLAWMCRAPDLTTESVNRALDLGCGSGILALAAARLFQARVTAVDIDPEATATTRENAALNGLEVVTHHGALAEVDLAGPFDLVLANIRPAVLIPQAPRIAGALGEGRPGILSGILTEEAPEVLAAYAPHTARAEVVGEDEEWCAIAIEGPT